MARKVQNGCVQRRTVPPASVSDGRGVFDAAATALHLCMQSEYTRDVLEAPGDAGLVVVNARDAAPRGSLLP
jgi:hypothetical protein